MGPVESAVRARFSRLPATIHTVGQGAPFTLLKVEQDRIVLLLGEKEAYTPLSWDCLESASAFLRGQGWVKVGGQHSVAGEPGTFDEHLKAFIHRDVAHYLSALLADAGVVEVSRRPVRVRLADRFV